MSAQINLREFAWIAILAAMFAMAFNYWMPRRQTIYVVSSTLENATEQLASGGCGESGLTRAQADDAARKQSAHVYSITVTEVK